MGVLEADVLVVGGGPAGLWAAVSAASAGAGVVLVDKGRCGENGPTALGSTSVWNIPAGRFRDEAVRRVHARGGGLGDPEWMQSVLAQSHRCLEQLTASGYPLADRVDAPDSALRVQLDGRRYLDRLRGNAVALGVRVLDRHAALQLLVDRGGAVAGASGVVQHNGFPAWSVRAGAVVLATGGCAFRSGAAGSSSATGEGLLAAVEAGAELSGMEFSGGYSLLPACIRGADATKAGELLGVVPRTSTLYTESSAVTAGERGEVFAALSVGRAVFAAVADLPEFIRPALRAYGAVNAQGRVALRAVADGTVRGTGGLSLVGIDCATTISGLYAAGDVATRQQITGAAGGFGGEYSAWAAASGTWAGAGAARFARDTDRSRVVCVVPGAGLQRAARLDPRAVLGLVQEHTLPLRRSYWRSAGSLRNSIEELDALWPGARYGLGGVGVDLVRARQAAAVLAVARWTEYSALARRESRGMHRRTDHPGTDARWQVRLSCGGLDTVWARQQQYTGANAPGMPQVRGGRGLQVSFSKAPPVGSRLGRC